MKYTQVFTNKFKVVKLNNALKLIKEKIFRKMKLSFWMNENKS